MPNLICDQPCCVQVIRSSTAPHPYLKKCSMRGHTSAISNPNKTIAGRIDAMINASRLNMGVCSYDILKGCGRLGAGV